MQNVTMTGPQTVAYDGRSDARRNAILRIMWRRAQQKADKSNLPVAIKTCDGYTVAYAMPEKKGGETDGARIERAQSPAQIHENG